MLDLLKVLLTLALIGVAVVIGYFIIGIIIYLIPFLLAVGVILAVIYGVFCLIFGKK